MDKNTYGIAVGSEALDNRLCSMARIHCGCGATAKLSLPGGLNPHHAKKHWERKGWECKGTSWLCPACIVSRAATRRGESGAKFIVARPMVTVEGLSRVTQRQVMRAVSQFLDDDGKYMMGMSDDKIAAAVGEGVTAEQVKLIRRMSPSDVLSHDVIQAEVETLNTRLAEQEAQLIKVLDLAGTIESVVTDLRGRARMLQEELSYGGHHAAAGVAD